MDNSSCPVICVLSVLLAALRCPSLHMRFLVPLTFVQEEAWIPTTSPRWRRLSFALVLWSSFRRRTRPVCANLRG